MNSQYKEKNSAREDKEFQTLVKEGYRELSTAKFQTEEWSWTRALDEEGVLLFTYLLHDFRNKILSQEKFEETVYTLGMLMHKLLPPTSNTKLSQIGNFQVIFNLYENLKKKQMSWKACEGFVAEQINQIHCCN